MNHIDFSLFSKLFLTNPNQINSNNVRTMKTQFFLKKKDKQLNNYIMHTKIFFKPFYNYHNNYIFWVNLCVIPQGTEGHLKG